MIRSALAEMGKIADNTPGVVPIDELPDDRGETGTRLEPEVEGSPWWQALEDTIGYECPDNQRTRWRRFLRDKAGAHHPDEIQRRALAIASAWTHTAVTINSLYEHFEWAGSIGQMTEAEFTHAAADVRANQRRARLRAQDANAAIETTEQQPALPKEAS